MTKLLSELDTDQLQEVKDDAIHDLCKRSGITEEEALLVIEALLENRISHFCFNYEY